MSYAPTPTGYRVDIGDAIARAYQTLLDNFQLAFEFAWLPFLLVLAVEVVVRVIEINLAAQLAAWMIGGGFFGLIMALILTSLILVVGFLVFGSIFAVRWHRFVLLGETSADLSLPPGWAAFVFTGVKLGLMALAGYIVLILIALLPPHVLTGLLLLIGVIAMGFLALRVSLAFPAAAIDQPIEFRTAWDMLEGNYWQLLVCVLACLLPFGVVRAIIGYIGLGSHLVIWIILQAVSLAVAFAGIAVLAALLSDVYRGIAGPARDARVRTAYRP
jgi:hypothetical protein